MEQSEIKTVIPTFNLLDQQPNSVQGTAKSGNDTVSLNHETLNNLVNIFSVTYKEKTNTDNVTDTTSNTANDTPYKHDLEQFKKWVKYFVSEKRKLTSEKIHIPKELTLRMKKKGTTINHIQYAVLKKTIQPNTDTPDPDDKYILDLLENDVFYTLDGKIVKHKGNGVLDYDISITNMSNPLDKCVDVPNTGHKITINQPYNILNNNPNILISELLDKSSHIKENNTFQLCIKMKNSNSDITNSTLVSMTILQDTPT